jgi:hypothetical protein
MPEGPARTLPEPIDQFARQPRTWYWAARERCPGKDYSQLGTEGSSYGQRNVRQVTGYPYGVLEKDRRGRWAGSVRQRRGQGMPRRLRRSGEGILPETPGRLHRRQARRSERSKAVTPPSGCDRGDTGKSMADGHSAMRTTRETRWPARTPYLLGV